MSAHEIESLQGRLWGLLDASKCARLITLPNTTNWSRIRVGALVALNGAATVTTPTWGMGICKGTTNILGDASVDHWIGVYSTGTWTYSGSGGYSSGTLAYYKKVGVTLTGGGGLAGYDIADEGVYDHVSGYFVDIVKGSPNYTVEIVFNDTVPSGLNSLAVATFEDRMKYARTLSGLQPAGYYFHSGTVACDESVDGYFTAANIYWSGSTADFCIDRLDVSVF